MMDATERGRSFVETGSSGPGVLLCHAWWGISPGLRRMAEELAAAGFLVIMPDLYTGRTATTAEDAERLRTAFPLAVRQGRFDAAVRRLIEHPGRGAGRIAAVGLSMGAAWALDLAATQPADVGAVVLYYGTGDPDTAFATGSFACLGHFAGTDEWEADADIAALRERLVRSEIPFTFHTYPGTTHWFAEPDVTAAFDPAAASLAMDRTVAFLQARLSSDRTG